MQKLNDNIYYIGVNDRTTHLFESMWSLPKGVSYNSYLIDDEKVAVVDCVGQDFFEEYLQNIREVIADRKIDYIIVNHMEPDHSGALQLFRQFYPDAKIVGNKKTLEMVGGYYGVSRPDDVVVADGTTLSLGKHELVFSLIPMVHWPEVVMTYDKSDKVLFSADAFGKFGALDKEDDDWACEARRYYFGIVGKYGVQVQNLFKKIANLEINTICPLHGPVLDQNLGYYLNLYNVWSTYAAETEGVFVAYASVYGHTKAAAQLLAESLEQKGVKVAISDLARSDWAECVGDAFRYSKLVLAAPTYNGDVFPAMKEFILHLTERNFQNRKVAFIENGSHLSQPRR